MGCCAARITTLEQYSGRQNTVAFDVSSVGSTAKSKPPTPLQFVYARVDARAQFAIGVLRLIIAIAPQIFPCKTMPGWFSQMIIGALAAPIADGHGNVSHGVAKPRVTKHTVDKLAARRLPSAWRHALDAMHFQIRAALPAR
jgi:hypothetical protein